MRVIVAGAGEVGWYAAEQISAAGHDVTLLDNDQDRVQQVASMLDVRAWAGPASSAWTLLEAGVKETDLLAAVTGSDETNIVCASIGGQLGAKRAVARVDEVVYRKSQEISYPDHFGIDDLISPEMLAALELASAVRNPGSLAVEHYARGAVEMQQFWANKAWKELGKPLHRMEMPTGVRVASIKRGNELIIPQGGDHIEHNDLVTLIGKTEYVDQARAEMEGKGKTSKHVVIMGGGHVALSLVRRLHTVSYDITIIERDGKRCDYLAEILPRATILHGDGTNLGMLQEERVDSADFFISTTASDETNIMSAVQAKDLGVKKVFVVIHRPDYVHLVQKIGVDLAVSPRVVMARELLTMLQQGKVTTLVELPGSEAEILEVQVSSGGIAGKLLREIKLPQSSLILTLQRDKDIMLPDGDTVFQVGDKVLVICRKQIRKDVIQFVAGK